MGNQFVVAAALDDASVLEYHDGIRVAHGGQTVRDDKDRSAVHQTVHALLYQCLGAGIDGACRLVENHNRGIGDRCARNRDQLALTLGQVCTVVGEHGVIALGQTADELVGVGQLCCDLDLLVGRIQTAIADVLAHGAGEQVGVLQDDAQRAAQIVLFDLVDVDAVIANLAVGDVVEAVNQVCDRGLARTGRADKGQFLTGLCKERDVVQDGLVGGVGKVHVEEAHVTGELGVGERTVLVGVLPRPNARALGGLDELAVLVILGIDQRDIAFVLLGLLIHERKDTGCTCQRHDDRV